MAKNYPKPETLRAFGEDWTIKYYHEKVFDPVYSGHLDFDGMEVKVQLNNPEPAPRKTLLHEMIHLADIRTRSGLTEDQVARLEHALWHIFADNKHVLDWIFHG